MAASRHSLERRFERWLWRFRLIAIVPVIMSLISAAAAFVCGTLEILHSLKLLLIANRTRRAPSPSCWVSWWVGWTCI